MSYLYLRLMTAWCLTIIDLFLFLCMLSKVFEKVMYSRLIDFLEANKNLFLNQFGFPKKHSSCMALTLLFDKLTKALENGNYVIGLFLDFSKTFDTVNHYILLENWIIIALEDRHWHGSKVIYQIGNSMLLSMV